LTVVIAPTVRFLSRDSKAACFAKIPVGLHQCAAIRHHRLPTGPRPFCQSPDEQNKSQLHVSFLQKHRLCEGPDRCHALVPLDTCWGPFALARNPCVASTSSPTACNLQSAIHKPQSVTPFFSSSSKLHSASSGTSPRQLATPNRMVCSAHPTPKATLAGDQRIIGPRHGTGGLDLPQSVSP
jgi:hypothetical protein